MNFDQPILPKRLAGLLLRLPLGVYFFLSGRLFLHNPDSLVQVIQELQIFPTSLAQLYALALPYVLVVTGVLLAVGFLTTLASYLGLLIIASYLFIFGIYPDSILPFNQYVIWFASFLALLATGPGILSIDTFRDRKD